ncbi:MAG: GyrI-like domain-containing protein [Saprospiraceae bacterium]
MIETTPTTYGGYVVQEMDAPVKYFVGIREKINMSEMTSERFGQFLPKVFAAVKAAKVEVDGPPCGLFFLWDEANQQVELAYAVSLKAKASVPGLTTFEVPAGQRLLVDYYGPYAGTGAAHAAMDEYVKVHQLEGGIPVWEEYVTDPMAEPDTAKWLTKVWYPVRKKTL